MTPRQRAFYRQAASDWAVFAYLRQATPGGVKPWRRQLAGLVGVNVPVLPVCHELHYLQMCTEKLAKAYFLANPPGGHAAFRQFLRSLLTNGTAVGPLGFSSSGDLTRWVNTAVPVGDALEDLAPALADRAGLPNPEYPWPKAAPVTAPVDHPFVVEVYSRLATQARSGEPPFLEIFGRMVETLPQGWHL